VLGSPGDRSVDDPFARVRSRRPCRRRPRSTAAHLRARLLLYRDLVGALVLLTRDLDASLAQRDSSNT
jgi:hypothetical protein